MRRPYYIAAFIALIAAVLLASTIRADAITVCNIFNGCIGTSTAPAYGQLLVGGKSGEFEYVASSTLGGPSASSTLLSDNNTFSGTNAFAAMMTGSLNNVITVSGWPY